MLVEYHMGLLSVCDRITVLDFGKLIAEGAPAEIQNDPAVIRAYLGSGDEEAPQKIRRSGASTPVTAPSTPAEDVR